MLKDNHTPIVIFITCGSEEEAETVSGSLVEKNLVACGNILPNVTSIFRWKGAVEHESEVLLIVKSRQTLFDDISSEVERLHSYETPEIIALPIIEGSKDYLDWLIAETSPTQ